MNTMTPANTESQHMRSVDLDQFTGTVAKDMLQWARDRQALFTPLLLPIVLMFIATVLFGFGGDQWNIGLVDRSGGSAVVLAVMVGAALNSALIIAREWEHRTAKELQLAPRAGTGVIAGKITAGLLAGMVTTAITLLFAITIFGLRIPLERIPMLLLYAGLVAIGFAGLGIAVGAWLKDYRAVQPLILVTLAGSFFAAGGFSSVPTLPAGVRAFDQYWPPSWAFEIINNHTFMATPPDPTQPLVLLGLLSVAGVAVGAMAARRQL